MLADLLQTVRVGEPWTTLVLLDDPQDAAYTQSGINAVSVAVYDVSSATPTVDLWVGLAPAVSSVFFDTLQTSDGWDLPDGFNFKHTIQPTDLNGAINGGHLFKVVYTIETVLDGLRLIEMRVGIRA
jgi:hypothetical protein